MRASMGVSFAAGVDVAGVGMAGVVDDSFSASICRAVWQNRFTGEVKGRRYSSLPYANLKAAAGSWQDMNLPWI